MDQPIEANTNNAKNGLYECYFYTKDVLGATDFSPFFENAPEGLDNTQLMDKYILHDTLWSSDMTFGWTFYQGLSLNSQTSVNTQMLIKKYYTGYEVQPTPRSAWSGMVRLGPKPDLMAMQALMDAFYELKDCMPARYNFWGTLASIAGEGIKTFGSSLLESLLKPSDNKVKNESSSKKSRRSKDTDKQLQSVNRKLRSMQIANNNRSYSKSRSRSNSRSRQIPKRRYNPGPRIRNNFRRGRSVSRSRTNQPVHIVRTKAYNPPSNKSAPVQPLI